MYWILLIRQTISNEKKMLIAYGINTILLLTIFNLMLDQISVMYPLSVSLYILMFYLGNKMYRLHRLRGILEVVKRSTDITWEERKMIDPFVFQTIEEIHHHYSKELEQIRHSAKEKNIVFSQFAHNMKTSVAVTQLAIESQSEEAIYDIQLENYNQKKYLEEMLNLLRFEEFSNDYIPQKIKIRTLVEELINSNRRDFIYSGIYPKINGVDYEVYTDPKWCRYILWQVLSNAIKYSLKGSKIILTTYQEEDTIILEVEDQGIGIPEDELGRVFEMFYTGKNGRDLPQGTGIGLAMVKKIASKLGHEVSIESHVGEGTIFRIGFLTRM